MYAKKVKRVDQYYTRKKFNNMANTLKRVNRIAGVRGGVKK